MTCFSHAQQNTLSSGGNGTGTGGSFSFSIGQIDYVTSTGAGGTATQGVQQPYEIFIISGIENIDIYLSISVYPNPSSDFIILTVPNSINMSYSIYDINWKLIKSSEIINKNTHISLINNANGVYLFVVKNREEIVKTFKIIKI
jgi:hypothetical protein